MNTREPIAGVFRFGIFELDTRTGELRRNGLKLKVATQPLQILQVLVEHPGELVTREQLRDRLWASGTFVNFDLGLNSAVRKLREALDDSAENPRFVQTLPRRGYRFIVPVSMSPLSPASVSPVSPADRPAEPPLAVSPRIPRRAQIAGGTVFAIVITAGVLMYEPRWWFRSPAATSIVTRSVHPEAQEAYFNGVRAAGRQTYEGYRSAVAYFEQAIAKQPDFAEAYAALSRSQRQFLFAGPLSPREVIPKAEAAARKALTLDDTQPQAHQALAAILFQYYWNWDEGNRHLRRAVELSDNVFEAEFAVLMLLRKGLFTEAITETERVRRENPHAPNRYWNAAVARRAAGQFDEALSELRRGIAIDPTLPRGHFQMGVTLALMNRHQEAIDAFETANRLAEPGGNQRFQAYLGYALASAGRTDDARRIAAALEAVRQQQYVSSFGLALIYDALGDKSLALAEFERAYHDRAVEFSQIAQYPPFKTIASDPQFRARVREIGIPH
jgi:DNA-binding winged helix-turn-helix (wHTH) protein/tetratricopeptide (TPR) repeat protein